MAETMVALTISRGAGIPTGDGDGSQGMERNILFPGLYFFTHTKEIKCIDIYKP